MTDWPRAFLNRTGAAISLQFSQQNRSCCIFANFSKGQELLYLCKFLKRTGAAVSLQFSQKNRSCCIFAIFSKQELLYNILQFSQKNKSCCITSCNFLKRTGAAVSLQFSQSASCHLTMASTALMQELTLQFRWVHKTNTKQDWPSYFLHKLSKWLFPAVHFDDTHSRNDFIHHFHSFISVKCSFAPVQSRCKNLQEFKNEQTSSHWEQIGFVLRSQLLISWTKHTAFLN